MNTLISAAERPESRKYMQCSKKPFPLTSLSHKWLIIHLGLRTRAVMVIYWSIDPSLTNPEIFILAETDCTLCPYMKHKITRPFCLRLRPVITWNHQCTYNEYVGIDVLFPHCSQYFIVCDMQQNTQTSDPSVLHCFHGQPQLRYFIVAE